MRLLKTVVSAIMLAGALTLSGQVQAKEILRVATEGAYPPFNALAADGTLSGFDVDVANAICVKLDMTCKIVAQDWDGMIPALLAKKFDVIVASMAITEARKKQVDFTAKYWQAISRFVVPKGSHVNFDAADLGGKKVGVQRGTIQACYVAKHYPKANVALYPTLEDGLSDLKSGRLDAFVAETIQSKKAFLDTADGAKFEFAAQILNDPECFGEGVGIALRKGNEKLRDDISAAILALRADGTYQAIDAKYFDFDVYGPKAP